MNASRLIFLFLFIILSNAVVASKDPMQEKIDYYISQAKYDSAQIFIQSNLDVLEAKQNDGALSYQLIKVLFIQSNYDEALKQAYSALDKVDKKELRVKYNFMIGCIYSAIKDYGKSIEVQDLCQEKELHRHTFKVKCVLIAIYKISDVAYFFIPTMSTPLYLKTMW